MLNRSHLLVLLLLTFVGASAQAPPEPVTPPAPPPAPVVYRNSGDAIALTGVCADAEMQEHGLACSTEEPCPVYLELDSIAGSASKLLVTGNLHTGTETLWSVLLWSADGGSNWTESFERVRNASLYLAQCVDESTCYAATHTSGGVPRDPRVVRTTDGGKTWRALPLLEEGSVGLIESLHFDTGLQGRVQVDRGRPGAGRFATLQTADGGETWTTTATTATRPARVAPPLSTLRIVAERTGKTLRIERREGPVYRAVARFGVAAGHCRPEPRVEPVTPPPAGDAQTPPPVPLH